MKKYRYTYNICNVFDSTIFKKQCVALERNIDNLKKGKHLTDVDGTETQMYYLHEAEIVVKNDYLVDAVYVDSDIELTKYFR